MSKVCAAFFYKTYYLIIVNMKNSQKIINNKITSPPQNTLTPNANLSFNEFQDQKYNQYSRMELIRQIKNKDQRLMQLKMNSSTSQNTGGQQQMRYKVKLEQEIAQNQKAVKAFGEITQIIISIIRKFQGFENVNRQSVASLFGGKSSHHSQTERQSQQSQIHESQFSCLDQIIEQSIRLLQYLGKLTQESVSIHLNLKKELGKVKSDRNIMRLSDSKRKPQQQIYFLKKELNIKIIENKNLQKMLAQQQQDKNKIISSIKNCLSEDTNARIKQMDKDQLIDTIQKMGYRIKELEKDKRENFAKNMIEKQGSYKKYRQLLKQVKQLKEQYSICKSAY